MNDVVNDLKALASPQKAEQLQRFFKTGEGEYGYGDIFWGINVPLIRTVARAHKDIAIDQLEKMLEHPVHDVRHCALMIMVMQSKKYQIKCSICTSKKLPLSTTGTWSMCQHLPLSVIIC